MNNNNLTDFDVKGTTVKKNTAGRGWVGRVAAAAAAAAVAAGMFGAGPQTAQAGTGGADAVGIWYSEGQRYCEVANIALQKRDNQTGAPLAGAKFRVTVPAGVGLKKGIYFQGDKTNEVLDRDKWQRTFNQTADQLFTDTAFGVKYKKAMLLLVESQGLGLENGGAAGDGGTGTGHDAANPGSTSETNAGGTSVAEGTYSGMIYTPDGSEKVFNPADFRDVEAGMRAASMTSWLTREGHIYKVGDDWHGTWSVQEFATRVKTKLDAIGAIAYVDYQPNAPKNPLLLLTGPITQGEQFTQDAVAEEYGKAYRMWAKLKEAVAASGYPDAVFAPDGTITPGALKPAAQNWDTFVAAYTFLVDVDGFPYGVQPPDYTLVSSLIGEAGVDEANKVAHAAVGASYVGGSGNGVLELTTDADGRVEYTVFGRWSERTSGLPVPSDCSALVSTAAETAAPAGYVLNTAPTTIVPRDTVYGLEMMHTVTLENSKTVGGGGWNDFWFGPTG